MGPLSWPGGCRECWGSGGSAISSTLVMPMGWERWALLGGFVGDRGVWGRGCGARRGDGMGYRPYGRVGLGNSKPGPMGDGFLLRCLAGREFPAFCLRAILLSVTIGNIRQR